MKRFYFSDDEYYEDEDEDIDESKFLDAELLAMTQLGNSDSPLLSCAIKICEKTFLWRFFSLSRKTNMIEKVFTKLKKITEKEGDDLNA